MSAPELPPGLRVYAIGDIHGEAAALDQLHQAIIADAAGYQGALTLVYLGDYVDRGPDSAGVIERLIAPPPPGFARHCLKGNHEAVMGGFLDQPEDHLAWLDFGGLETLASYGVRAAPTLGPAERGQRLSIALNERLPAEHRAFLADLSLSVSFGDYFFVHAGIRPGRALDRQIEDDLLWIREPFLSADVWHGKKIVHGHTVVEQPEVLANRIAIDTGAYAGGGLTCLVLEGASYRFIVADSSSAYR